MNAKRISHLFRTVPMGVLQRERYYFRSDKKYNGHFSNIGEIMKFIMTVLLMVFFAGVKQASAQYQDTIHVPVTYYDFRSNGSNPEFQVGRYYNPYKKNMVQRVLGPDKKPVAGSVSYFSNYLKYWYRDWKDAADGDNTSPVYDWGNRQVETPTELQNAPAIRIDDVGHDTSFVNRVIHDVLVFNYVGGQNGNPPGTYEFQRTSFFPLDGRGFDNEGKSHNYSFTMELHWEFTKVPGLTFRFTGDDDVWAFIQDTLRMDLGGIHIAASDSFKLDQVPGLENGKKYTLDFFYAERQTTASRIQITTNIISAEPAEIFLEAQPKDSVCAGSEARLVARVIDGEGKPLPDFEGKITWSIISKNGNNTSQHLKSPSARGDTIWFAPTEAYTTDTLFAQLTPTISAKLPLKVYVCKPESLFIEERVPDPNNLDAMRNKKPAQQIDIPDNALSGRGFAILRDRFGNFYRASDSTRWEVTQNPGTIDRIEIGKRSDGEGIIFKNQDLQVDTTARVKANGYVAGMTIVPDDVPVVISKVTYTAVRITRGAVREVIDSIKLSVDDTTLLVLQGRRKDNGNWVDIGGSWSINPSRLQPVLPSSGPFWNFNPADTGSGTISATSSANSSLSASIKVIVTPGAPQSITIFPDATSSAYRDPSGEAYSVAAGKTFPLYAKVFDKKGIWLKQYDNRQAAIEWTKNMLGQPSDGSFNLDPASGNQIGFIPTKAGNYIHLLATFTGGSKPFRDTVRILVIPGDPARITIQTTTDSLLNDLTSYEMQSDQTSVLLYAHLRDEYYNFISLVKNPNWYSKDTSVVDAAMTDTGLFIGEGKITRKSDELKETYVVVTNEAKTIKDSIRISLTNIKYTALSVYTLVGGTKTYVDTIRVRTDSSLTLYVEGKRSTGDGWDDVIANWAETPSLLTIGNPPTSKQWEVVPEAVSTGKIFVTRDGATGDTVVAIFLAGLPAQSRLYHRTGDPALAGAWVQPPVVDTIIAGDTTTIVAKIFDRNNVWLSTYENSNKNALYTWTVAIEDGDGPADTLNRRIGYDVKMIPKKAYITYRITMTFSEGTKVISSQLLVYVKPGAVDHLVIEGSPDITGVMRQRDNPLMMIDFGSRDTVKNAYAILRDKFGNYIDRSQNTDWSSLDPSVVSASEGITIYGEGRVIRVDSTGSTKVVAVNRNNTNLRDTVDVELSQFSYDSLRIVVNDSIRIQYLEINSDQDTVLQVLGKRSFDGVWVPVTGDWSYTSNNGSLNGTNIHAWTFAPQDTGAGKIIVTRGSSVPDTILVVVHPGDAAKLQLYAKEGKVPSGSNPPYPDPLSTITATAGTPFPMVAKILDHRSVWLYDYEQKSDLSRQIKWKVIEKTGTDSSGFLDDTAGHKRSFMPVRAYQSVYIVAELNLPGNRVISDTIQLAITYGKIAQLVLEGSSTVNLNKANPIDTARITDNTTTTRVYAILRDSIGNFVNYSTVTSWGVVNNDTAVSIRGGNTTTGEGVISRNVREKVVKVFAADGPSGFRDSTVVKLLPYYFKELRIVVAGDTSAQTLTMNTNQDTTLTVQGLRSDSLIWVNLEARWENSSNLKIVPQAPGWDHEWYFSPSDTGSGWIRVTYDNDAETKPDTLKVQFTPGPPTEVSVTIITPPDKRIAGEPIEVVVTIRNEDGLVPGTYCFNKEKGSKVVYTDTLGTGGKPQPFVIIGNDTVFLAKEGEQCFKGGSDTITSVLFYATDSLHRLTVQVGDLRARTTPFILHPGPLASLKLEDQLGNPIGDTVSLSYPKDHVTILAIGYDKYGNRIGQIPSNWSTDSTLHRIDQPNRSSKIIYQASSVTDNEAGTITAVPSDGGGGISAQVFVKIVGPYTQLTSVKTGDENGNGYLDRMTLTFSKPVAIPEDYDFSSILIRRGDVVLEVESVIGGGEGADSVWVLVLKEEHTTSLQTGWRPIVTFDTYDDLRLDSAKLEAIDGAGPVIVSATKTIKQVDDVKKDEISIKFSEPIQRRVPTSDGKMELLPNDSIELILYVWEKIPTNNGGSEFRLIDSMLQKIELLQDVRLDSIMFLTENGADIAPYHYVTIRMLEKNGTVTSFITDRADKPNLPDPDNQKVRITVNTKAPTIKVGPNPTTPTETHVKAGDFEAKHYPDAWQWVRDEKRGVMIELSITLPNILDTLKGGGVDPSKVKIRCVEKIYDFVGNPIQQAINEDLVKSLQRDMFNRLNTRQKVTLYWNGFTESGRPAAPGIYQAVIYIEYMDSKLKKYNERFAPVIGIGH